MSGTRTSCSTSSLVSEASSESFPFWSLAVKPGVSVGTMKPRIDLLSLRSPVLAQTTAMLAVEPLVIHILAPFSTHPSSVFWARVIIPPGLEPKSGSVSPKQPITSPAAIRGRYSRFCSSLPKA